MYVSSALNTVYEAVVQTCTWIYNTIFGKTVKKADAVADKVIRNPAVLEARLELAERIFSHARQRSLSEPHSETEKFVKRVLPFLKKVCTNARSAEMTLAGEKLKHRQEGNIRAESEADALLRGHMDLASFARLAKAQCEYLLSPELHPRPSL